VQNRGLTLGPADSSFFPMPNMKIHSVGT